MDADSYKEICYPSVELSTTNDQKCSGRKLLATDFPHIKNVRTSEYFIEGYTIYTLNIHFGWYQWPYDRFEKTFTQDHLAIAMSNPDMIIPTNAGTRRSNKDKQWGKEIILDVFCKGKK